MTLCHDLRLPRTLVTHASLMPHGPLPTLQSVAHPPKSHAHPCPSPSFRNLVAAARQAQVRRFVLVTSIGADELLNPLNLFWGVLFWKKRAEEDLQRSGLAYTVVRPGGLKSELREGETLGPVVMAKAGTYGLGPGARKPEGPILRSRVRRSGAGWPCMSVCTCMNMYTYMHACEWNGMGYATRLSLWALRWRTWRWRRAWRSWLPTRWWRSSRSPMPGRCRRRRCSGR